ncbi:MAG: metal-sensing transcriptional repressor [Clostridia bacterium]|nr:metal-sensing transcriptional repressor [Clostridia bacterium]
MERHEHTKAVINRMSRAIGHMNAVKRMIEEERDCSNVLIQLSAIRAEIAAVSKVILKDHIGHCIVDAVKENDEKAIEKLEGAIDKLL